MATLAMDQREPEVARFIDTYKFDQQMENRRDQFGGGTSLPLNSDGYDTKQQRLREERRKDFLQQNERPKESVYYRVGTPEEGLPGIGEYANQRQKMNVVRQREYNDLLKKQKQIEGQRLEARRQAQAQSHAVQPQGPQMDYDVSQEQANLEAKRSYQDYMGKYQHPVNVPQKPQINYEENRKVLSEERRQEYNILMEKKAKEERYWAMRGKPVTPPGGLNIGQYDRQMKEQASQKKKEYKEMLDKQKNEQLKHRAWDRVADVYPGYVKYREEERPLVGSPRDINNYMHEKQNKDIFRKDLKEKPQRDNSPPSKSHIKSTDSLEGGPDRKSYIELERERIENQRKYRDELLQQQKEHLFLRARQEPEIPVLDRNVLGGPMPQQTQFLASKPPPGPSYRPRDEQPSRQTPSYWTEGKLAGSPLFFDSEDSRRPNKRNIENPDVPLAFRTEPFTQLPPPDRLPYGQPPYPGEGQAQGQTRNQGESSLDMPFERERRSPPPRSVRTPPNESRRRYSPSRPRSPRPSEYQTSPRRAQNSLIDEGDQAGILEQRKEAGLQRQKEYNEYLKIKAEDERRREESHRPDAGPAPIVKNQHYSGADYEEHQRNLRKQQGDEYREYISKSPRNYQKEGPQGLNIDVTYQDRKNVWMERQRNKEYNDYLKKQKQKEPPRRHDYMDTAAGPYSGLFHGLGEHGNNSDALNNQRKQEYNEKLEKQFAGKDRHLGRPNWVRETLPNNTDRGRSPMRNPGGAPPAGDHYQQILEEKRREEQQRRRFDDPEYQGRLASRERGENQPRYGY